MIDWHSGPKGICFRCPRQRFLWSYGSKIHTSPLVSMSHGLIMVPIIENQPVSIIWDLPKLGMELSEESGDTKVTCSARCVFVEFRCVRFDVWRDVSWQCRFEHLGEFRCFDPPPTKTRSPTLFTRPGNAGGNGRSTAIVISPKNTVTEQGRTISRTVSRRLLQSGEPEGRAGHRSTPPTHRGRIHATHDNAGRAWQRGYIAFSFCMDIQSPKEPLFAVATTHSGSNG